MSYAIFVKTVTVRKQIETQSMTPRDSVAIAALPFTLPPVAGAGVPVLLLSDVVAGENSSAQSLSSASSSPA
jgi:hypothetical protein